MSLRDSLEDRFISGDVADASSVPSIDWSGLGLGVLGSAILASVVGFSETILAAGAWVVSSARSSAAWIEGLGESFGSSFGSTTSAAVGSFESFAGALGPAAFPVAVGLVVSTILVAVWVVRNVG